MSDYLNNLAARTLNLAPVVQPRLASLFEPLSVATGNAGRASLESEPAREDLSSTESTFGVSAVRPLTSQADKMRQAMTREPKRRGVDRTISSPDEADTQERPVDAIIHHPTVTPSARRIDAGLGPSSIVSERDPVGLRWLRSQTHQPNNAQANSSAFAEGEADDFENSPRRGSRVRHVEAGRVDQTDAIGSNHRDRVQPAADHTSHGSLAAIALIQPDRVSVTPTRRAFTEPASTSEVPPTISVTIGRVDVRAVFSQPPAPRVSHAKRPAAMSLDEYLKQRNEGHR